MRKSKAFQEWTASWLNAMESEGDHASVLGACRLSVPRASLRVLKPRYDLITGFRRNVKSRLRGEQHIESKMLGPKDSNQPPRFFLEKDGERLEIRAYYNHTPLTKYAKGQVYPDIIGTVCTKKGELHSLAIEVKVDDHDCWYAAVENLKQIRLLRANIAYLKTLVEHIRTPFTNSLAGTWGLVLAPMEFFDGSNRRKQALTATRGLLDALTRPFELRVILGVWDETNPTTIKYLAGYWPH